VKTILRIILLSVLGYTIAGLLLFCLSEQKTVPRTPWYWQVCQILIQPVMNVCFDRKESRWFHWVPAEIVPNENEITIIHGDPKAPCRGESWISNARVSLGMWRMCAVIAPPEGYKPERVWYYAFVGRSQRCTIQLRGQIRILIGPDDAEIFGISSNGEILKLRIIKITKREDPQYREYPLI